MSLTMGREVTCETRKAIHLEQVPYHMIWVHMISAQATTEFCNIFSVKVKKHTQQSTQPIFCIKIDVGWKESP